MRNILFALTLIVAFAAGGITVNQYLRPATAAQDSEQDQGNEGSSSNGSTTTNDTEDKKGHGYMDHKELMGDVDHTVTNIDNGVVIDMTSTNEETIRLIREHKAKKQEHMKNHASKWHGGGDITRSVENIDNGVRVTITSDDPETVQRLQEHKANGMKHGGRKHHGGHWSKGMHQQEVSES